MQNTRPAEITVVAYKFQEPSTATPTKTPSPTFTPSPTASLTYTPVPPTPTPTFVPTGTPTPTAVPTNTSTPSPIPPEPKQEAVNSETIAPQSSSLRGATSIPAGEWDYFAMDPWGGQSEFIGLTIKPEDAQNGVITFISTNYGPCSAAFGDIPVELEEGEIKFNQFTSHGSVVGSIKVDKDKIAVLIDDFYCTDDLFGVLTRKE